MLDKLGRLGLLWTLVLWFGALGVWTPIASPQTPQIQGTITPAAPGMPGTLGPFGVKLHSIRLVWTWSQGTSDAATGFHVLRSFVNAGGPYTLIGDTLNPSTQFFTDTIIQTAFYEITAYNKAGDSSPSQPITCAVSASSATRACQ